MLAHWENVVLLLLFALMGVVSVFFVRSSRRRHIEQFGPAPAGTFLKTVGFFFAWLVVFLLPALYSRTLLAVLLVAWLFAFQLIGFFTERTWSLWQQARDGGVFAILAALPVLVALDHFWYGA